MILFNGCGVAIATPFNKNGEIQYDMLEKHIEYLIANSADCIVACGTTGESATLSLEEKLSLTKFIVEKVNKRVTVLAGSGSNDTKKTIELSKEMAKLGVDGLLIVTPYYNKATQKGLITHYTQIANQVNVPIILYNVPSRTGLNMAPSTVKELAKISNIVGIKEASGDVSQFAEIAAFCDENFALYSGNDDHVLPIMALGGEGVITTIGNIIPKDMHDLIKLFPTDIARSRQLQLNMLGLIQAIFCEVNPIPVKQALELMGLGFKECRPPLYEMEPQNLERLTKEMKAYGLI